MNDETLLVEKQDGVAMLTLNRPEVMNSFNFAMLYALKEQIDAIRFDQDIRVIIVTGSGQKAFCAGADLKERADLNELQVKEFIFTIRNLFTSIEYLNKPVIAAINGVALGGGAELCLACDIRIAAMNASIGLTETRLAIIPGGGGTQRLPRLIGRGKAKELTKACPTAPSLGPMIRSMWATSLPSPTSASPISVPVIFAMIFPP